MGRFLKASTAKRIPPGPRAKRLARSSGACHTFLRSRHLCLSGKRTGWLLTMLRKTLFLGLFLTLFSLALAQTSCAQDSSTQLELGAQYSTIRETNYALEGKNFSGFGGRFDWNLTRRLAFESQIDYFRKMACRFP